MGLHTRRLTDGSEALKAWIDRRGIKQIEAAKLLGIHFTLLNHYLTGLRRPPLVAAIKIERATGIPVEAWVSILEDEPSVALAAGRGKRR